MGQASFRGAFSCALLTLVLGGSVDLGSLPVGFYPRFTPFFFLCTHRGEVEQSGVAEGGGEMLLTLQISDNPTAYIPGQEYQGECKPLVCVFCFENCMENVNVSTKSDFVQTSI